MTGDRLREPDDWKLTYEKVEPHGLCCAECKASRLLLADVIDALEQHQATWYGNSGVKPDGGTVSALLARFRGLGDT